MDITTARVVRGDDTAAVDEALADATASYLLDRVHEAKVAHVALSGGSLAERALPRIIEVSNDQGLDWAKVHIWFADERFVPRGTPERNAGQVVTALRVATGFQAENLHIPAGSDSGMTLDEAAADYAARLTRVIGISSRNRFPSLDLVLLGMGPDGHTASLFPGLPGTEVDDEIVIPVRDSPKPPDERISLTFPMLAESMRCWIYATGEGKRDALKLARSGTASRSDSPVGHVTAIDEVALFADAAALGE
ncbi:6-phosphogluconolactonase [Gulosibacter molinativorax]|uniref:6-phosphogluconolactonase n=1 Tax=Gulosibacter molinativorax TaxID=256821 RepID=A0ABT7C7C9_9MICO|nr:6-phosphogluconolactonase [Gulosibacter molinativorax]MDJ1371111.1 6-phosphogluconolactonase [Gulosibacter molinativorax]QUY61471.1 6-phosphogluconolactonase [Gulosibacter molinativorax]